jgi:hypothetical protein
VLSYVAHALMRAASELVPTLFDPRKEVSR